MRRRRGAGVLISSVPSKESTHASDPPCEQVLAGMGKRVVRRGHEYCSSSPRHVEALVFVFVIVTGGMVLGYLVMIVLGLFPVAFGCTLLSTLWWF